MSIKNPYMRKYDSLFNFQPLKTVDIAKGILDDLASEASFARVFNAEHSYVPNGFTGPRTAHEIARQLLSDVYMMRARLNRIESLVLTSVSEDVSEQLSPAH